VPGDREVVEDAHHRVGDAVDQGKEGLGDDEHPEPAVETQIGP
jgi:hypothetical protein